MHEVQDNADLSQHRPDHKIVVVLPHRKAVEAVIEDLAAQGHDLAEVLMLHGAEGLYSFDLHGDHHGRWAHVRRTVKNVGGVDANTLFTYYEALEHGHYLLFVPLAVGEPRDPLLSVLRSNGGTAMSYFTPHTMESIPIATHT
jgi:hypothetical protein